MALDKYKNFVEGDILPAENVNSIDPDNPVAQTPAQLIGGYVKFFDAEVLVVAAGGGGGYGGGYGNGGGGGAGEVYHSPSHQLSRYNTVSVGTGGSGSKRNDSAKGQNGGDSILLDIIMKGGGGGGSTYALGGNNGGSGGGGGSYTYNYNPGVGGQSIKTIGFGNNGSNGDDNYGGGGGGAGGPATSLNGGAGIEKMGVTYGVGGGAVGGANGSTPGSGGFGRNGGDYSDSGDGSDGIVIIKYLTSSASGLIITGGTKTIEGNYTIHTFTSNGTLEIEGGPDNNLQNFINLASGDNNGKFTANIDGVYYIDVAVDLSGNNNIVVGANTTLQNLYTNSVGQSFTIEKMGEVKRIGTYFRRTGVGTDYNLTISLYNADSNGSPIGDIIKTITIPALDVPADSILYMNVNQVLPAGKYHIVINPSYQSHEWYLSAWYSTNTYAGGEMFINGSKQVDSDLKFSVEFENQASVQSLNEVSNRVQSAIRLATGKSEIVRWHIDKFIISSTVLGKNNGSSVLRLIQPTTGTDISGAGYLDLGANATEVAGDGDDYRLVRLDKDGQIPVEIFNNLSNTVFDDIDTTAKSLNTVYQNTTDKNKLVIASIYFHITVGADATSVGQIGETNNPTTVVSTARIKGGSYPDSGTIPVFMLVKPGWYYRVSGGTSVASWFECDLI